MLREALLQSLDQIRRILDRLDALASPDGGWLYAETGIGRHLRHINDHFLALIEGGEAGWVDYNRRHRDSPVECDLQAGRDQLEGILDWCRETELEERSLRIVSEIDCRASHSLSFESNLSRELLYLINHTIHHAAYIRLRLAQEGVELPPDIGLAPGTASYLRDLEQARTCAP